MCSSATAATVRTLITAFNNMLKSHAHKSGSSCKLISDECLHNSSMLEVDLNKAWTTRRCEIWSDIRYIHLRLESESSKKRLLQDMDCDIQGLRSITRPLCTVPSCHVTRTHIRF